MPLQMITLLMTTTFTSECVIHNTVQLFIPEALNDGQICPGTSVSQAQPHLQPHPLGTASPLGLHHPLDKNLEDKILWGATFLGSCFQRRPAPLHHPTFTNDPLRDKVSNYAHWGLVWTTQGTYSSGEKRFIQFCLMNHLVSDKGDILPTSDTLISVSNLV